MITDILWIIEWLKDHSVLDALNALMTIALVLFAVVQIGRAESERRERTRAAVGSFWVEFFRMWRVSRSWAEIDFDDPGQLETFDPDEILPPDWGAVLPLLGSLGAFSARLGGLAYAYAADAADAGRKAQRAARLLQTVGSAGYSPTHAASRVQLLREEIARQLAEARSKASLANAMIEDAISAAPRWATKTRVVPELLSSEPGRNLAALIEDRQKALPWWKRVVNRVHSPRGTWIPDREKPPTR